MGFRRLGYVRLVRDIFYSGSNQRRTGLGNAGLPRWRTQVLMNGSLGSRKILMSTLNKRAETVLRFCAESSTGQPRDRLWRRQERSRDSVEIRRFCRRVAADGMVLLKNQGNILPIRAGDRKIAVIGPNADAKVISGGGSAALKPPMLLQRGKASSTTPLRASNSDIQ